MQTLPRTSTTEMEVTSIRLERDLKERLKAIAGNRGYQALIRDVLWLYVQQKSDDLQPQVRLQEIRASVEAIAQREEHCALTGTVIAPQSKMLLGWTVTGEMVPLSLDSLA
ncbi:MAG: hypothetical protein AAGF66_11305 [Cyanobacteria bacterium P01_H01_bin.119]